MTAVRRHPLRDALQEAMPPVPPPFSRTQEYRHVHRINRSESLPRQRVPRQQALSANILKRSTVNRHNRVRRRSPHHSVKHRMTHARRSEPQLHRSARVPLPIGGKPSIERRLRTSRHHHSGKHSRRRRKTPRRTQKAANPPTVKKRQKVRTAAAAKIRPQQKNATKA